MSASGSRWESTAARTHFAAVAPGLHAMLCADRRAFAVASRHEHRDKWRISLGDREFRVHLHDPLEREVTGRGSAATGPQEVRAPIPGKVVSIAVAPGDTIAAGAPLVVLEMKMQNR